MAAKETSLFTRGKPGESDNRGESMVEKHKARLQAAKENTAAEKLAALLPAFGSMVRSMALTESNWDVTQAHQMLKTFEVDKLEDLEALRKRRKNVVKGMEGKKKGSDSDASADASTSGSEDSAKESGSDSKSDSPKRSSRKSSKSRRKEKKRGKEKKRSKGKRKREDSDSDSEDERKRSKSKKRRKHKSKDKDKDKDKKKEKRGKEKKSRRSPSSDSSDGEQAFGKYGILTLADRERKSTEFAAWAAEVRGIDLDAMPQFEEKELWKEFAEDYNLACLPSKKYYDVELWKKSLALKGEEPAKTDRPANITDEELKKLEMAAAREAAKAERMAAIYAGMKKSGQASEMREQALLRAQMALAYKTGNKEEAKRIAKRLEPDTEQDRREAAKRGYKPKPKDLGGANK